MAYRDFVKLVCAMVVWCFAYATAAVLMYARFFNFSLTSSS